MDNIVDCGYVHTQAANPAKPPIERDCGCPLPQPVASSAKAEEPPAAGESPVTKPVDAAPEDKPARASRK